MTEVHTSCTRSCGYAFTPRFTPIKTTAALMCLRRGQAAPTCAQTPRRHLTRRSVPVCVTLYTDEIGIRCVLRALPDRPGFCSALFAPLKGSQCRRPVPSQYTKVILQNPVSIAFGNYQVIFGTNATLSVRRYSSTTTGSRRYDSSLDSRHRRPQPALLEEELGRLELGLDCLRAAPSRQGKVPPPRRRHHHHPNTTCGGRFGIAAVFCRDKIILNGRSLCTAGLAVMWWCNSDGLEVGFLSQERRKAATRLKWRRGSRAHMEE